MATVKLARREREALDVLYRYAPCTVADVQSHLGGSYAAARAVLSRLARRGLASHRYDGPRYVYEPTGDVSAAAESALKNLAATFFGGSNAAVMDALLGMSTDTVDDVELRRLEELVAAARKSRRDNA
ncbi:MAG: BlaI/MecI/CopY family transcriptional regulator [Gammaproteobacteria bacterium]|nr:BlaI/MecI/CopY family transcriptional regulator [Gammaproteobacteria bacterium]